MKCLSLQDRARLAPPFARGGPPRNRNQESGGATKLNIILITLVTSTGGWFTPNLKPMRRPSIVALEQLWNQA